MKIRSILYPTDFSECSRPAFDLACSLAGSEGARLIVMHVAEPWLPFGSIATPLPPEDTHPDLWRKLLEFQPSNSAIPVDHRIK